MIHYLVNVIISQLTTNFTYKLIGRRDKMLVLNLKINNRQQNIVIETVFELIDSRLFWQIALIKRAAYSVAIP